MPVAEAGAAEDARKRAKQRCADERKALLGSIFQKYHVAKDGLLTKDQLGLAIFEKTGELPSTQELDFVFLVADQQPKDGKINLQEFSEAIIAYECYLEDFRNPDNDLSKLFDELDTDNSGGLNKEQLRNLLERYSSDGQVKDGDVEDFMRQADLCCDGEINRIELKLALAMWFQKMCTLLQYEDAGPLGGCLHGTADAPCLSEDLVLCRKSREKAKLAPCCEASVMPQLVFNLLVTIASAWASAVHCMYGRSSDNGSGSGSDCGTAAGSEAQQSVAIAAPQQIGYT